MATTMVRHFPAHFRVVRFWFAVVLLSLASGCARLPVTGVTSLKPANLTELNNYLLGHKPDIDQFRLRGPFTVTAREDHVIRISANERATMDLFTSAPRENAPLVIFLHGHEATKGAHAYQAMHLASWGMHSISLQLPSAGPWIANGRTLARIVNAIHRSPELIDSRIDASRIVLVGHSFGGAAVAVALAEGAQAAGGILLDPAGIGKDLPGYLKRVSKPVMVLGADEQVFTARNRGYFHRYIPRGVVEVSIKNASHEDAQYPSAASLQLFGLDYTTTEGLQLTFVSAMTAAAFSLAVTGKFDYAWTSFGDALESGRFLNAKKK